MSYCIVQLQSQTACFRNPEFFNYHKSFPVPPPTTLMGMAGAAMGLSPKASQEYFADPDWEMGVYCYSRGTANDLWKFFHIDKGQRSVILRELRHDNTLFLAFGHQDISRIKAIQQAFMAPAYPLCTGSNDMLAHVHRSWITESTTTSRNLAHCMVAGDIVEEVMSNTGNGLSFSIYSSREPTSYQIPTAFSYESIKQKGEVKIPEEYGFRKVIRRKLFSFIGEPIALNIEKQGLQVNESVFIPLFFPNT